MPDPTGTPTEAASSVAGPPVQGSVYGGHAPIQGAHVYLLQPGITGYGSAATSLLGNNGATSAGGYVLTANVNDPNVPTTTPVPKYVTTDSNGEFSLTGAWNCVVNQPVYIYAYGGNIGTTTGTSTTTYTISQISVTGSTNGTGGTATYTATISSGATITVGQSVTVAGLANHFTILNAAHTVTAVPTSTSFTFVATDRYTGGNIGNGTYPTTGNGGNNIGTAGTVAVTNNTTTAPTTNNNIVQLATLGNCPATGGFPTTGSGSIGYIYLNEVSTVATAYTFQPFTLATNNSAWDIGSPSTMSSFPVTSPVTLVTDTQALLGIANAANTAAQLYNIQGSSTLISTSGDGEGHLANNLTANGNGIVPEATIDSLANILAACVDSVPTTVGVPTTTCSDLFTVARADGTTTGTEPIDTATAAINIARYPAGNHSSGTADPTYVKDIFDVQSGTVPYVPDLFNPPNDWTIAIIYPVTLSSYSSTYGFGTNAWASKAESIEVDANADIWVTGQTNFSIVRLNNLGVIYPPTAQNDLGYIPGYVSVDGSNNAWTGNATTSSPIFEAGSNGVFTATYGTANDFTDAYVDIADYAGDDYFFATYNGNYQMYEYPLGSTTTTVPTGYSIASSGFGAGNHVAHGAIDASHDFWLTSETNNGGTNSNFQIAKVTSTGTNVWVYNTQVNRPEFVAIDANGTGWIPSQTAAGPVYKITSNGVTRTSLTSGSTGATLSNPFGVAVDGNGNVWVTNRCGNDNTCDYPSTASSTLVEINGATDTAISPSTNYLPKTQYPATATGFTAIMTDPLNLAIDPSGNIWITNYAGDLGTPNGNDSSIVEIVGAAAPVVTPLATAAGTNKLGTKP